MFCKNRGQSVNKEEQKQFEMKKKSSNASESETKCNYYKELRYTNNMCVRREKMNNAVCYKCNRKGHYAKNCDQESKISQEVACVGIITFVNQLASTSTELNKALWILDPGCTAHVYNNKLLFENLDPTEIKMLSANSDVVSIKKQGNVKAKCGKSRLIFMKCSV